MRTGAVPREDETRSQMANRVANDERGKLHVHCAAPSECRTTWTQRAHQEVKKNTDTKRIPSAGQNNMGAKSTPSSAEQHGRKEHTKQCRTTWTLRGYHQQCRTTWTQRGNQAVQNNMDAKSAPSSAEQHGHKEDTVSSAEQHGRKEHTKQ